MDLLRQEEFDQNVHEKLFFFSYFKTFKFVGNWKLSNDFTEPQLALSAYMPLQLHTI